MEKKCVFCKKVLTGRKRKYCNDDCKKYYKKYYNGSEENMLNPRGTAQRLRIGRANNSLRRGRLGVRYN